MTDNAKVTGLIGGPEKRQIEILNYQPTWPQKFQQHADLIAKALNYAALRIEHIGSTSVPGLASKPIIDILLVVQDSADEGSYLPHLEATGYELRVREPEWHEHRMFRTPDRDVHIHVFTIGCPEIARNLTFRDQLRKNAEDRLLYEQTKRRLATQDWPTMNDYAKAKTDVIEGILAAASKK